ncbi:MAG: hypothetical protein ACR2PW_04515 [Gammaproteobacteria bacterium]
MARLAVARAQPPGRIPVNRNLAGQTLSIPAPVGGWNTRDALDAMPPTDAVVLDNWFPDTKALVIRSGHASHATGVGSGSVETVAQWRGPASSKLLAAGGGEVYDATSSGAASVLTSSAGYTVDRWQTANFNSSIFGVNGTDAPWDYDGTTFSTTSWTGVTATSLVNVSSFKGRLIFVEKNTGSFWYPASVGAKTGALTEFDLGQIAQAGGFLMATASWSVDAGEGIDDRFVAVFSSGEVLVYQGSDPGSDFAKLGSYFGGEPIGRRCFMQLGGELIIITKSGYLPLSVLVRDGTADAVENHPVWGKIRSAQNESAMLYSGSDGWEAVRAPSGKELIFNVPTAVGDQFIQHVQNTITGAWCRYTGLDAYAWGDYSGDLYFGGGGGIVYKHTGNTDDGGEIPFTCKQAFSYLGDRGRIKDVTSTRPMVDIAGSLIATIGLDVDFSERNFPANNAEFTSTSTGTGWDEDDWDVAEWGDSPQPKQKWFSIRGCGRNFSVVFQGTTSATLKWYATDLLGRVGGIR